MLSGVPEGLEFFHAGSSRQVISNCGRILGRIDLSESDECKLPSQNFPTLDSEKIWKSSIPRSQNHCGGSTRRKNVSHNNFSYLYMINIIDTIIYSCHWNCSHFMKVKVN